MKSIEISRKHGFDPRQFDDWLKQSGYKFQSKLMSLEVDESQKLLISNRKTRVHLQVF